MRWTPRDRFAASSCAQRWTPSPFGLNPSRRNHLEEEKIVNTPAMIGQSRGHGRSRGRAPMLGGAQLIMDDTKIVHAADQIHAGFKRLQAMSGVTASACQGGQTFAKGGVQPLDKGRVEHVWPP